MKILILSKIGCAMCDEAVNVAKKNNIPYEIQIVDKKTLQEKTGKLVTTYPQVFINNNHIGTNFDLEDYVNDSEPILTPTPARFTVFPIKHENLWLLYKKAQGSLWTAEEIDFSSDMTDWKRISEDERNFIKHVLAFFASSDGIVFENIMDNFLNEVQLSEAKSFYAYQGHNEMVHGETYSLLIDKYITDAVEKNKLFTAIETIPCIKSKATWALKWFDSKLPFRDRLISFVCVEGIFFPGSFCAIFWLKKRGLLPGLSFSNELISRDEGLHVEFAVELFHMLNIKPSRDTIVNIITESVSIEKDFIVNALPCKLLGMDSVKMSTYIEYVADRLMKQLGYDPIWKSLNPFDFMENISLDGKTNFFEKRVGDYGKLTDMSISFDEKF